VVADANDGAALDLLASALDGFEPSDQAREHARRTGLPAGQLSHPVTGAA
jgi:hypothetical protein